MTAALHYVRQQGLPFLPIHMQRKCSECCEYLHTYTIILRVFFNTSECTILEQLHFLMFSKNRTSLLALKSTQIILGKHARRKKICIYKCPLLGSSSPLRFQASKDLCAEELQAIHFSHFTYFLLL
jgi:hypothetical protein